MAKKKSGKNEKAARSEKVIQYFAAAVILLVAAFLIWPFIPKPSTNSSIGKEGDVGISPACERFNSIPAANEYGEAPPLLLDESKQYFATFKMAAGGEFVIELFPEKAPITVNSFVFLSCKNFYEGVTFHRVLDGFMAQGGDPTGTGMGGPGYEFVNENSDLTFDKEGVLAMANAGPDTNGSQFFITYGPQEFLNGGYSIFGQVIDGMDVVNSLTRRDPDQNPDYEGDAIASIMVIEK